MEIQTVWLSLVVLSLQHGYVTSQMSACSLALAHGPCQANFDVWGFEDGQCRRFVYSGCGGNNNRFKSQEDCEQACPTVPGSMVNRLGGKSGREGDDIDEERCSLTPDMGPCEAATPRWASVDGVCKQFIYGGCEGNANNFETEAECEKACGGSSTKPSQRPARCYFSRDSYYFCSTRAFRWFYSRRSGLCLNTVVCDRRSRQRSTHLPGYRHEQ